MTHLTREQLHDLTARINERLNEFDDCPMPNLSPGIVRLVHSVIAEWQEQPPVELPVVTGRKLVKPPDPDVARERLAEALSKAGGGRLLEAHWVEPETIDDDEQRQRDFDEIVRELRRIAMGDVMPRMSVWDAVRPTHLPKAQATINRYRKSWSALADIAGLRLERRSGQNGEPVSINGQSKEAA